MIFFNRERTRIELFSGADFFNFSANPQVANPTLRKSANLQIRKPANPHICKSAIRKCANQQIRKSEFAHFRKSANPQIRIFANLQNHKSANPQFRKSANPKIRHFGLIYASRSLRSVSLPTRNCAMADRAAKQHA